MRRGLATLALLLSAPLGAQAATDSSFIKIPGQPVKSFGAIIVDPVRHLGFLSDRSNHSVDAINLQKGTFDWRVAGFSGPGESSAVSGPQGLVLVNNGKELWATDGDSTIKIIDLLKRAITGRISTGGAKRTGELAYDPVDHVTLATNPSEKTQFISLISTDTGHKILARIQAPTATEGIERSIFFAPSDRFYVPMPRIGKSGSGGVAEIDPRQRRLVKIHLTPSCNPHSVQALARERLLIGCNFGRQGETPPRGQMIEYDLAKDRVMRSAPGLGGDGQTAFDVSTGRYFAAANKDPHGPVLRIVDLAKFRLIRNVKTWPGSHSVAVDESTHRAYVPETSSAPCGGCVLVLTPPP